jgi:tetratricopeptide (TPR) repeat protein
MSADVGYVLKDLGKPLTLAQSSYFFGRLLALERVEGYEKDPRYHCLRSFVHLATGEYYNSIKDVQVVRSLDEVEIKTYEPLLQFLQSRCEDLLKAPREDENHFSFYKTKGLDLQMLREMLKDNISFQVAMERLKRKDKNQCALACMQYGIMRHKTDPNETMSFFNASILMSPTADAYLNRAKLHAELGNIELAMVDCERSLKAAVHVRAYLFRAFLNRHLGELARSLRDYLSAYIVWGNTSPHLYFVELFKEAFQSTGVPEVKEHSPLASKMRESFDINGGLIPVDVLTLNHDDRLETIFIEILRNLERRDPSGYTIARDRISQYIEMAISQNVIHPVKLAITLTYSGVYEALGGHHKRAHTFFEEAIQFHPLLQTFYHYCSSLLETRKIRKLEETLSLLQKHFPGSTVQYCLFQSRLYDLKFSLFGIEKDSQLRVSYLEKARSMDPSNPLTQISWIEFQLNKSFEAAKEAFDSIVLVGNPDKSAYEYWVYYSIRLGRYPEAQRLIHKLDIPNTIDIDALTIYADYLIWRFRTVEDPQERLRIRDEHVQILKRAIYNEPSTCGARIRLAILYFESGDVKLSIEMFTELVYYISCSEERNIVFGHLLYLEILNDCLEDPHVINGINQRCWDEVMNSCQLLISKIAGCEPPVKPIPPSSDISDNQLELSSARPISATSVIPQIRRDCYSSSSNSSLMIVV